MARKCGQISTAGPYFLIPIPWRYGKGLKQPDTAVWLNTVHCSEVWCNFTGKLHNCRVPKLILRESEAASHHHHLLLLGGKQLGMLIIVRCCFDDRTWRKVRMRIGHHDCNHSGVLEAPWYARPSPTRTTTMIISENDSDEKNKNYHIYSLREEEDAKLIFNSKSPTER